MKNKNQHRQAGFTLVEILVVIVIVGLLAGIVGPSVFSALSSSEEDTCRMQVIQYYDAVQIYFLDKRQVPESWDVLYTPDEKGKVYIEQITEAPKDPWGNEYEIRSLEGGRFEIRSWGADKIADTEDDISSQNAKDKK